VVDPLDPLDALDALEPSPRGHRTRHTVVMTDIPHDLADQLATVERGLLDGEQVIAVYDAKGAGTGFIGLTDIRVILQNESYVGGRIALTSVPYSAIHAVSLVSNKSFLSGWVEAATVAIVISGQTYEIELRGHEKAQHVHDVILFYAAGRHS
jgi:hypothetical protein